MDEKFKYHIEEHVAFLIEQGAQYFSHMSPENSSAKNIVSSIIDLFVRRGQSMSAIRAVGSNWTVTITGHRGEIIVQLESHILSPVQWFVCQLHPIGKAITGVEHLPGVEFEAIDHELPMILKTDLSADQKYLFFVVSQDIWPIHGG